MQAWEVFLEEQTKRLGKETVDKWLKSLKVIHFDACNLYLEASDSFQILWFEEHIRHLLPKSLLNNNHHRIKVHLTLAEEARVSHDVKALKAKKKEASTLVIPSSDSLDPWSTFENFISPADDITYKILLEAANNEPSINPIFVYGESGTGKTHLLMSFAAAYAKRNLSYMFVNAENFTEHVVSAIRSGSMREFRNSYRHVDLLIIDDVHLFARRNATQEELFHTFNTLHTENKQIVLSANCAPQLLNFVEPRLVSRFEWGISLKLEKISTTDIKTFLINYSNYLKFPLNQDVISFLTDTFTTNLKNLQQALKALILRSSHKKMQPNQLTLDAARNFLKDLVDEEKKVALSPTKIIKTVADFYGIKTDDILGKSQNHECALPRQVAMHLCRSELNIPFIKIGMIFSRDHSTVISSVKQISKRITDQDKEMSSTLPQILRQLRTSVAG